MTCSEKSSFLHFYLQHQIPVFLEQYFCLASLLQLQSDGHPHQESCSTRYFLELADLHKFEVHQVTVSVQRMGHLQCLIPGFFGKICFVEAVLNGCVSYVDPSKH